MGATPDWYGVHPGLVWGSPRTGMGVAPDWYGGPPGPVWGPGIGIINIGYIELGPYFCLFFAYFCLCEVVAMVVVGGGGESLICIFPYWT